MVRTEAGPASESVPGASMTARQRRRRGRVRMSEDRRPSLAIAWAEASLTSTAGSCADLRTCRRPLVRSAGKAGPRPCVRRGGAPRAPSALAAAPQAPARSARPRGRPRPPGFPYFLGARTLTSSSAPPRFALRTRRKAFLRRRARARPRSLHRPARPGPGRGRRSAPRARSVRADGRARRREPRERPAAPLVRWPSERLAVRAGPDRLPGGVLAAGTDGHRAAVRGTLRRSPCRPGALGGCRSDRFHAHGPCGPAGLRPACVEDAGSSPAPVPWPVGAPALRIRGRGRLAGSRRGSRPP